MSRDAAQRFSIPRFRLPWFVARLAQHLPQWPHAAALSAALNAAARGGYLPRTSLDLLDGRSILVEVTDAGAQAVLTCAAGVFRPLYGFRGPADVAFRVSLAGALQLLARQEDPDTLFFNRELSLEGDTELGLVIKNMLDTVELPEFTLKQLLARFASFAQRPSRRT